MKSWFSPTIHVNLQFTETHYSHILHWKNMSCSRSARIAIFITFILCNFALLYLHFNSWLTVNFIFDKMNIFYFKLSKKVSVHDYRYFDPNQNSQVVLVFVHIPKTIGTYVENALTREGVFGLPCQCTDFKRHANVIETMTFGCSAGENNLFTFGLQDVHRMVVWAAFRLHRIEGVYPEETQYIRTKEPNTYVSHAHVPVSSILYARHLT